MTLLELAHSERLAYLKTLNDLVLYESPTSDKPANDVLVDHLTVLLKQDGWQVERIVKKDVGDQLLARWEAKGEISTLLLCHCDTVWPCGTLADMPLREEKGRAYGPGILDMKAGITTAIYALRIAQKNALNLKGPVTLLLSTDEEKGSHYSRELIEHTAKAHDRVLVLEPGRDDGALKIARKGIGDFTVEFTGLSAHAGNNPKDGASALRELAHFLFYAERLNDEEKGTSVNVTLAQGGVASNVIAEKAQLSIDMRVESLAEAERVEQAILAYKVEDSRVTLAIKGGVNRPPMEQTQANRVLYQEAEQALTTLGVSLEAAMVGGGSDGNFTSALGIPTLDGLGASGAGPHARHEHIRIAETLDRLALVTALLTS